MDITALSALIGAASTLLGAGGAVVSLLLFRRQRARLIDAQASEHKSSGDAKIMDAAAGLVTQAGSTLRELGERLAAAETKLDGQELENGRLREDLADVRLTVSIVSADNAELRSWVGRAVTWMQRAVDEISRLQGHIDAPPPPPEPRQQPFPVRWPPQPRTPPDASPTGDTP